MFVSLKGDVSRGISDNHALRACMLLFSRKNTFGRKTKEAHASKTKFLID